MDVERDFKALFRMRQVNQLDSAEQEHLMQRIESGHYDDELSELYAEFNDSDTSGNAVNLNIQHAIYQRLLERIRGLERIKAKKTTLIGPRPLHIAVAATLLTLLTAALYAYLWQVENTSEAPIETTYSNKQYFRLPDGTAVTLNDNSKLTYTQDFGQELREVTLSGEAFFDVAHVPNRPFIVRTREISTMVLGTAFNINSSTTKIIVTVMRGTVKVSSGKNTFEQLAPNEALTINPRSLAFKKSVVDPNKAITWKARDLVMDEVTMKQAAIMISTHFNVKVLLTGETLEDCKISAFFIKNETLDEVLESISVAKGGTYIRRNGIATISGECQ